MAFIDRQRALRALANAVLLVSMVLGSCRSPSTGGKPTSASASAAAWASASQPAPLRLPPLSSEPGLVELQLPIEPDGRGSGSLWLSIPHGATEPRPVIIVRQALGADTAELCSGLSRVVQNVAFLLCQGLLESPPVRSRIDSEANVRRLREGLKRTKARFGPHVASGGAVLVSINEPSRSLASLVRGEPGFFSRVLTIGSEFEHWSATTAKVFGSRGGQRALFGCTAADCLDAATLRAKLLETFGASARAVATGEPLDSHGTLRFIERHWDWLIAGDARFSARKKSKQ